MYQDTISKESQLSHLLERVEIHAADDTSKLRPAVLVLPGGAYGRHAPHEGVDYAKWLNSLGFHAFVFAYAVAPHKYPTALVEAQAVLNWIAAGEHGLPVNPECIGVMGSSAGGHLAAMLSSVDPVHGAAAANLRPAFQVLCYPLISFESDVHMESLDNLIGRDAPLDVRRAVSVDANASGHTASTFIWTTADDASVHAAHALRYAEALARKAVDVELHVFPNGEHGLGLAPGNPAVREWVALCERWLQRVAVAPALS